VEPVPLTAEDRAILALEGPAIAGHTCKVVVFDGLAPTATELTARICERFPAAPALAWRLGGSSERPVWVAAPGFDPAVHVASDPALPPLERSRLRERVARLFVERLPRDRPLWRIDVIPLVGGGAALVWRIHHALADGATAMRYARELLWDAPAGDEVSRAEPTRNGGAEHFRNGPPRVPAHARAGASENETGLVGPPQPSQADQERQANQERSSEDERRRAHLTRFFAREFAHTLHDSPFDGQIGARREVAFAILPLRALHDAAKRVDGATLNDAVLTSVGGGLRRWLEAQHGRLGSVRVKVPVSLHAHEPAGHEGVASHGDGEGVGEAPGNRDSFFAVDVPLAHGDALERLRAVHAQTAVRKAEHDAETMDALLRELRGVSPALGRFCERVERGPRAFALNVSNVPGPREPVTVLGAPVSALHSIAELGSHHALRVAAVSLADMLCLGFCADPDVVEGVRAIAHGTELEAHALIAAS
jgi:diacylglycerol O-acyltransferase / wax synthase